MTLARTTVGINKAEDAGAAHVQIRFSDALRRVLPTRLTSYFEFRGRICQETLCVRSSVAFDLRQCALRPGFAGPVPASSSGAARGRANARILPWQTSIATLPTFPRSGPVSCSHCRPTFA